MKQHITAKQLNELSEKGKKRLRKWCKEHILVDMSEARTAILPTKKELADLYKRKQEETMFLSIGQMIEFLGWEEEPQKMWEFVNFFIDLRRSGHAKSICNELWQEVKEKLEK